jgi:ATP-binding cassette subfamily F protein 3
MELEETLEQNQNELMEASNKNDNSKVIELSSVVLKLEKEVEENFELLEENQLKLDEILEEYEVKLQELEA